tara:strand:- start:593 stop:1450 length:858 start_codon:yes stop_codon:yes gene_type:complete
MQFIKKIIKKILYTNIYTEHLYHYIILKINPKRFHYYPFGNKIITTEDEYLKIFNKVKNKEYSEVLQLEKSLGYKIDSNWLNELALLTQVTVKESNICYAHGRVLYSLLAKYSSENKNLSLQILEIGTSKGFSSLCMAKALEDYNHKGNILSLDIIPNDIKIYWNSISDKNGKKTRTELLQKWANLRDTYISYMTGRSKDLLRKLTFERINFAFIDGSHTYYDVLCEFNYIAKRQMKNDILIVDDYNLQYKGLIKASNQCCKDYNYIKKIIKADENRTFLICVKN